jgi:hypothetical protein
MQLLLYQSILLNPRPPFSTKRDSSFYVEKTNNCLLRPQNSLQEKSYKIKKLSPYRMKYSMKLDIVRNRSSGLLREPRLDCRPNKRQLCSLRLPLTAGILTTVNLRGL